MKFTIPRPEGGNEHSVVWNRRHNCRDAAAFRSALEDPDIDLLQFSVGLVGFEMPLGIPFVVTASAPCRVCGGSPSAFFEWSGPKIWVPGQ